MDLAIMAGALSGAGLVKVETATEKADRLAARAARKERLRLKAERDRAIVALLKAKRQRKATKGARAAFNDLRLALRSVGA